MPPRCKMNLVQHCLVLLIRLYQLALSPLKNTLFGPGASCRFTPTCSEFALEAVRTHGVISGTSLGLQRLLRCHPWGNCGHDPVPAKLVR